MVDFAPSPHSVVDMGGLCAEDDRADLLKVVDSEVRD